MGFHCLFLIFFSDFHYFSLFSSTFFIFLNVVHLYFFSGIFITFHCFFQCVSLFLIIFPRFLIIFQCFSMVFHCFFKVVHCLFGIVFVIFISLVFIVFLNVFSFHYIVSFFLFFFH